MTDTRTDPVLVADPEPIAHARRRLSMGDSYLSSSRSHTHDAVVPPDPDTCRICRGEGTLEEPLFYPCKCSGSIKYVHQDCLMEWLSHSQKKHCELCKTPFRFTKLYSPTMPRTLPLYVFVSHIAKYLFRNVLVWLRAGLVASVWLGWLPYLMRSVWSFLFWISDEGLVGSAIMFVRQNGTVGSGDDSLAASTVTTTSCASSPLFAASTTAATIGGVMGNVPLSSVQEAVKSLYTISLNSTDSLYATILRFVFGSVGLAQKLPLGSTNTTTAESAAPSSPASPSTLLSDVGLLRNLTRYPVVNRTIISVLEGQTITILVVVCFILIILVRDYVVQQQPEINMRAAFAAAENPPPAPPPVAPGLLPEDVEHLRGPDESEDEDEVVDQQDQRLHLDVPHMRDAEQDAIHGDTLGTVGGFRLQERQSVDGHLDSYTHPTASQPHTWAAVAGTSTRSLSDRLREGGPGQADPAAGEESTVHEYLRVYREAGGDPEKILKIVREEHLEGRLDYWIGLTKLMAERKKLPDKDSPDLESSNTSTGEVYGAATSERSGEWDHWSIEAQDGDGSRPAKGKERAEDSDDEPLLVGNPLRPRANTDGPQRYDGINPLANNNWSFSELQPEHETSHGPVADLEDTAEQEAWNYPTPPSSSFAGSASPVPRNDELAAGDLNIPPWREADEPQPQPRAATPATGHNVVAQTEWANLPDFNEIPAPRPVNAEANQAERAGGLLGHLANFMWRDIEAIDPQELIPAAHDRDPDNLGQFGDVGQEPEPVDDMERDQEVIEAAAAAGLDAEAIEDAEDLEGVMELLGMRGPIAGLFQNAIFCAFLVSITIFLGVFLPYNFGRLSVWVVANPVRPINILFTAAKLVQDVVFVLLGAASCAFFYVLHLCVQLSENVLGWKPVNAYLASTVFTSWNMSASATRRIVDSVLVESPLVSASEIRNFSAISHDALLTVKGNVALVFATAGQAVAFIFGGNYSEKTLTTVTALGNASTIAWHGLKEAPAVLSNPGSWVINLESFDTGLPVDPELAYWDGTDRFWAIAIGYFVLCMVAALYLRRGTPFSSGQTGQEWEASIIDALNQASGVMKVILIIGIEMLVFPLYCGLLLDAALLPLFEDTTLMSRVLFTVNYPLTSIFVHWFVGTGYMFHFALFVSMCRKIMRKGVLYFIRDPDDPEFHPVRDVLERNVTTQLRKILFSAFVYGALVIICLGGVVWGLALAVSNVLPIHYSSNEPVLEFPIDLLFYNFLMPLAVKFFKPSDGLHAMYTWWFRKCARILRITWFLFGERKVDEEGVLVLRPDSPHHQLPWWKNMLLEYAADGAVIPKTWVDTFEGGTSKPSAVIPADEMIVLNVKKNNLVQSQQLIPDGRFVRTPASDQVKIPKNRRVFLEVSESNLRLDEKPDGADTDLYSTDQYQFVYIPPHFRFRVFLFILSIWIFAAVTGVGITIVPLVFGRRMFKLLIPAHIRTNDIYAFSIGVYLLGSLAYLVFHTRSIYNRAKEMVHGYVAAVSREGTVRRAARIGRQAARLLYCYFFLLVVFPAIAATIMELYFLIPLHTYMHPNILMSAAKGTSENPRHTVRVIQVWTLGLIYLKLGARTITSWYEDTRPAAAVRAVLRRGWLDPDVGILTRAFVIPGLGLALVAIAGPFYAAEVLVSRGGAVFLKHTGLTPGEMAFVYRLSFPAAALFALALWALWGMVDIFRSWKVRIRDEAYLIGERLHNFGVGTGTRARRAWMAGGTRL